MTLDAKDIVLIVVSIFVSLCASWIANLSTPSLLGIFHRRKTSRIERSRKQALKDYAELQKLQKGNIDKYLYFNQWASQIARLLAYSLCLVLLTTLLTTEKTATTLRLTTKGQEPPYLLVVSTAAVEVICLSIAFFTLVFAITYSRKMELWRSRLEEFEQYKLALEAQFGKLPNEETAQK